MNLFSEPDVLKKRIQYSGLPSNKMLTFNVAHSPHRNPAEKQPDAAAYFCLTRTTNTGR
jgi:hypothetical protein